LSARWGLCNRFGLFVGFGFECELERIALAGFFAFALFVPFVRCRSLGHGLGVALDAHAAERGIAGLTVAECAVLGGLGDAVFILFFVFFAAVARRIGLGHARRAVGLCRFGLDLELGFALGEIVLEPRRLGKFARGG
jgi:hypothetical protein